MFAFLRSAPHQDEIKDQGQVKKSYGLWRIRVFYSMFLGYVFYYFTRKSFTFIMPSLMADLGMTATDLGLIATIWAIAYGLSKFVSGIAADRSNARYFMAFGLLATGLLNICFGFCSSMWAFALLWGANGWFQGFGWAACGRLLTHWYSQSERGRWWACWNTSQNIGGALIPIITACIAQYYGWRYAMIIPGAVSIGMALFLLNRLADTPQSLGLPPIERFRNDYPVKNYREDKAQHTVKEILFKYVLKNPSIWTLAVCNLFIYSIRMVLSSWAVLYFVEVKHYSQIEAGGILFWLEFGGIFGALAAGWASDTLFKGSRAPVSILFSAANIAVLTGMASFTQQVLLIDCALIFLAGFFIYGPQMLIGIQTAEIAHKKAIATTSGFVGWSAYVGAAIAGYPVGIVLEKLGWSGLYSTLIGCSILATALLLPLWGKRSYQETEDPVQTAPELELAA